MRCDVGDGLDRCGLGLDPEVSLCDTCREPGACCAGFHLTSKQEPAFNSFWIHDGPLAPLVRMAENWLPFHPVVRSSTFDDEGRAYYAIKLWACDLLGEDGRCTDYENRPQLCRSFEARSDPLCVEFKSLPATSATKTIAAPDPSG